MGNLFSNKVGKKKATNGSSLSIYRVTLIPIKEGSFAAIKKTMDDMDIVKQGFKGLLGLHVIEGSPTLMITIAIYDSEENANLSTKKPADGGPNLVEKAFGAIKEHFTGPPRRVAGKTMVENLLMEGGGTFIQEGLQAVGAYTLKFIPAKPGHFDKMVEFIMSDETQDKAKALPGMVSMTLIKLPEEGKGGEEKGLSIAGYRTRVQALEAQEKIKPILGAMKDFIAGPPEGHMGAIHKMALTGKGHEFASKRAYRVSIIPIKEGSFPTIKKVMMEMDLKKQGFQGLLGAHLIEGSPTLMITNAIYDSEENANLSTKKPADGGPNLVEKAFGAIKEHFTGPPKRLAGKTMFENLLMEGTGTVDHEGEQTVGACTIKFVTVKPGHFDKMMEFVMSDETQNKAKALPGMVSMSMIKLAEEGKGGEEKGLSIVGYRSLEKAKAAQEEIKPILGAMKDMLAGRPEGYQGTIHKLPLEGQGAISS